MICEHLRPIERELVAAGARETDRGQPWSDHCREWVTYDCYLDIPAIRERFSVASCIDEHVNDDVRTGRERGLFCRECEDAILGRYAPGRGLRFPSKRKRA